MKEYKKSEVDQFKANLKNSLSSLTNPISNHAQRLEELITTLNAWHTTGGEEFISSLDSIYSGIDYKYFGDIVYKMKSQTWTVDTEVHRSNKYYES